MKTQIVVVGGGAGGLELVRRLGARLGRKDFDIILVERNHTHVWKPLLHEVAAGALDANLDEVGYRSHVHRWSYHFFYGSLEAIDRTARQVIVAPIFDDDGSELVGRHRLRYDYLVIAIGSVSNDFGTPGVKDHCLFLEDRHQADRFRLKLLNHCLRVSRTMSANPTEDASVDIAIVGGGATGVELAAERYNAASSLRHYGLEVFDETRLRVTLIEAGPRILPALPEALAEAAHQELEPLGVRVLANTAVSEAMETGLRCATGEQIHANICVWAAGVQGPRILEDLDGLEVARSRQLVVLPTLQSTQDKRIFAIGDCCYLKPEGAAGQDDLRVFVPHALAGHTWLNQGLGPYPGRPCQPRCPSASQIALTLLRLVYTPRHRIEGCRLVRIAPRLSVARVVLPHAAIVNGGAWYSGAAG